jgi:hypothetical protein
VSQTPQLPFIPRTSVERTDTPAHNAPFRLARPFVHGTSRDAVELTASADTTLATREGEGERPLPPIEEFLLTTAEQAAETYAPTATPFDYPSRANADYELPPLEHFLDELPVVDSFAPAADEIGAGKSGPATLDFHDAYGQFADANPVVDTSTDAGWVDTDWQRYDWNGAAALGEGSNAEALEAWSETDWESKPPRAGDVRETAAQAIANALDHIANRIRHGELAVQPADLVTDPAAIAATLAALLGVRR